MTLAGRRVDGLTHLLHRATIEADVDRSVDAILRLAAAT